MTKDEEKLAEPVVGHHTTRTVLHDLRIWTDSSKAACHLTDSVHVFNAACALRDAIQNHLESMEMARPDR